MCSTCLRVNYTHLGNCSRHAPALTHKINKDANKTNIVYIYFKILNPFDTKRPEYGHWDGTACLS
jgi:hypothetical protein